MPRWRDHITLSAQCQETILNNALSAELRPLFQKEGLSTGGVIHARAPYRVGRVGTNIHVMVFTEAGSGKLVTPEGTATLNPGSVAILPAERSFEFGCHSGQPWHMAWLLLEADHRWPINAGCSRQIFDDNKSHWAYALITLLAQEAKNHSSSLFSTLIQQLAQVVRQILKHSVQGSSNQHAVMHALSIAEQKLQQRWTVAELAALANMSESYFYRRCQAITGQSPLQYIIQQRINCAKEMLANTDRPINHIASRLGYADVMRFSQAFKSKAGCSPTHFREHN